MIASQGMNVEETVDAPSSGAPLWLVTFADLTAILVALFVLIFSMTAPFADKGTGTRAGAQVDSNLTSSNQAANRFARQADALADLTIGYLSAVLSERGIARDDVAGAPAFGQPIGYRIEGDRLVLRLDPGFFFGTADSGVTPMGLDLVATLSEVLGNVANPVSVISPVPADNWTLAFDRADAMVNAFDDVGYGASIEKFVSPGVPRGTFLIVVARGEGGRF